MTLTTKEKNQLRASGNKLKPEVWIGKRGISEGSLQTIRNSFQTKELLKIKILEACPLAVKEVSEILARKTFSEPVKIVGNTILLYRQLPEEDR